VHKLPNVTADFVWMDGELVPWKDAKVHILTHAMHYGTSAFEGIRVYPVGDQMYVFRLQEHMKRLSDSCKIYGIDLKYSVEEMCRSAVETVRKNKLHSRSYIRPIVYVGFGGIGINFTGFPVGVSILAFPFEKYLHGEGVNVIVSSWRRMNDQTSTSLGKIGGQYTNSVLAKVESVRNGYDEAIMLDQNGHVSEGTGENIFLVRNGRLITPPLSSSILEGITRDSIFKIASNLGIQVIERAIPRSELYIADEVFFSGTAAEVTPIFTIDKKKVGDGDIGPLTSKIKEAFMKVVSGDDQRYSSWLTPVY